MALRIIIILAGFNNHIGNWCANQLGRMRHCILDEGGRQVHSGNLITVFGGSGFIGRSVVRALAKRGYRIRVAVRRPDLAFHLQPIGNVGQIHAVQANLRYPASIKSALEGADGVVNLCGLLHESGRQTFEGVHVFGAHAIAKAAAEQGITKLVHLSALGADVDSTSDYARTKAEGAARVRETVPSATILEPSVVFGQEDNFFNKFAGLARMMPVFPLIGGGHTKFQPLYVGDLAKAVVECLENDEAAGQTFELGGPEVLSLAEIMEFIFTTIDRKRMTVPLPFAIARFEAQFLKLLPNPILTPDQVELLKQDSIVSEQAVLQKRDLGALGIKAHAIEAIVPPYLARFRRAGQFTQVGHSDQA